jgi:hypothetical protein
MTVPRRRYLAGWAAIAAAALLAVLTYVPPLGPGVADRAGMLVLGLLHDVLFVFAVVTLRPAIFGSGRSAGLVATTASIVGTAAGLVGDLAGTVDLPFELLIAGIMTGQIGTGLWHLLAGASLLRAGLRRLLGSAGVAGGLGYFVGAGLLGLQVLLDSIELDVFVALSLVLWFAVAFQTVIGWLVVRGEPFRPAAAA